MYALTDLQKYEFDLTGYLIIRRFLPPDLVGHLNRVIDDIHVGQWPRKFSFLHLSPSFWDVLSDPRVMALCEEWLGQWFRLDHAFGIQDPPADVEQVGAQEDLHAGPYANQGAFRYNWFGNRPHCGALVFVYFLETVQQGDGGLVLVPGSHKSNYPLAGRDIYHNLLNRTHDAWWIHNPAMEPGDMLVFSEAVVHGSKKWGPHARRRRNLQFGYAPGFQASREYSQMLPYQPLARTELEKRLLRPPYVFAHAPDDGLQFGPNVWRNPTCAS